MQIKPKTINEAKNLVFEIFMQGDLRHFDDNYLELIVDFILNNGLVVCMEEFALKEPKSEDLVNIKGPQQREKFFALEIIKLKNLKFEGSESPFLNYKIDILAKDGQKDIAIECGPTRLWKAIDYLEARAELWITREDKNTKLFVISKGKNWNTLLEKYNQQRKQELKKVKSPIDSLF